MNTLVLLAIVAGMAALWFVDRRVRRLHILIWLVAWLVATYLVLRFGIEPPVPTSIIGMFLGIVTLALLAYLTATSAHLESARRTIVTFVTDRRYTVPLILIVVLLPVLAALNVYMDMTKAPQAPVVGRTIHPPPPNQIAFKGKTINLNTVVNPYRALETRNPAQFAEHVANGRRVYYENCVFCHGDNLEGDGHFAHGFDPLPANFADPQTIGILQESYLFWRIAKGGPGLPEESTPWSSAMPAWELFLTEEEIWDVILFLYDFTGHRPRAQEAEEESPLASILLGARPAYAQERQPDIGTEAEREAGRALYMEKCSQCHGDTGDGQGIAAPFLHPLPRDFTAGIYKVRTTASGELPSDEDLARIIRNGMPYTGMPAWPALSEQEIRNLVYFLKTFNDDFAGPYGLVEPVEIPSAPSFSEESAERGRQVYEENQCFDCHGNLGRGDGPSAPTLTDQWDHPIRAADLTKRWTFIGGTTRQDIYRTFTTGLDGTPMPSYDIPEEDRWALVDYVYSLSRDEPDYATVAVAKSVEGELDLSRGPALFEEADPAYFPVVGQVIEPGRAFAPGVDGIEVKAVYNADEIAIMLSWHDMAADTTGTNSPSLPAPESASQPDTSATAAPVDTSMAPASPEVRAGGYSDAVAVQIPSVTPESANKPYFLFGDQRNAMDIWFADLSQDSAALYIGHGSQNIEAADGNLALTSRYEDGEWQVIFKRPRTVEGRLSFEPEHFVPITFSVWDGHNQERGNRRGITSWYHLYLEPMETQAAALPMARSALLVLLVELGLVFAIRRKYRMRAVA